MALVTYVLEQQMFMCDTHTFVKIVCVTRESLSVRMLRLHIEKLQYLCFRK
jgi:hypothetical protein